MNDPVNNPEHYTRGGIETWDVLESRAPSTEAMVFHLTASAQQYLDRAFHKGTLLMDIQKAIATLKRAERILLREECEDDEYEARLAAAEKRIREALIKSSPKIVEFPDDHTVGEAANLGGHSELQVGAYDEEQAGKDFNKYIAEFYRRLDTGLWP